MQCPIQDGSSLEDLPADAYAGVLGYGYCRSDVTSTPRMFNFTPTVTNLVGHVYDLNVWPQLDSICGSHR